MNAATMMETCPDSETLAAFSDGALDDKTRLEVMQHVADCGQCQHELAELDAAKQELQLEPANVRHGSFGRRWIAPLAAAAAVVVVLFGVPSIRDRILGNPMGDLVKTANALQERPTLARLSGDFAYKVHRQMRGTEDSKEIAQLQVEAAASNADDLAEKNPSASNLHAAGVGGILMKDRDAAVSALQRAGKANPESATIQTDLAAAYLSRGREGDYVLALVAATNALRIKQTPAAAWNRALALELLGRNEAAVTAWQQYLELDGNSPWTTEARTRIQNLENLMSVPSDGKVLN